MQDAGGFHAVGGEAGEEERCLAVVEDHAALPGVGAPAAHLPAEAGEAVGGMVAYAAVEKVFFYEWQSGRVTKWLSN